MLIVKYTKLDLTSFIEKYNDNVVMMVPDKDNKSDWLIRFIEDVKVRQKNVDIVIVPYFKELMLSLKALKMSYKIVYPYNISQEEYNLNKEECDAFNEVVSDDIAYAIENIEQFELMLSEVFNWIVLDNKEVEENKEIENNKQLEVSQLDLNDSKSTITLKELIEDDVDITEADVRELKSLSNKFKVAMMLQAKSRLNTVLKLCSTLDKLYAELVKRIDVSLDTTDTSSLMYTADYISKALSETNQFIMSLITSEKLQNFFIIENSNIVSISDDRVDINKREKIRKAAEIVIDNIDYFTSGQYENIVNPNVDAVVEVENSGDDSDAENKSKPV